MDTRELAGIRQQVDEIAADVDVWAGREGPDARARRYASSAVSAIDAAISELHAIRGRLMSEIRTADAEALADPTPPALVGYGYVLPEDYLRGGGQ